jgi:heme/copper-type cytochrome/quinol oxidase subunit 4
MKDGFDVDSKSKKPVLEVEIRIKQTSYKWIGLLIFILLTVVAFLFVLRKYKK